MARKTFQTLTLSCIPALALCVAAPSRASAGNSIELAYSVEIAGATVLKARYRADIGDDRYEASLSGKTSGVSSVFSGYKMELSANGKVEQGSFRTELYENDRKKTGKKKKSTDIVWQPDGKVTINRGGELENVPAPVAASLGNAATDPLTAVLKMANSQQDKPCSGKFRAYDGKDVFDLSLSPDKAEDNKIRCRLTWIPVAGDAADKGEKEESYGLTLSPVQLTSGRTLHIPSQITGKSNGLKVVVSVSSVTVDGREIARNDD